MVESLGDTLLFHTVDKVYVPGNVHEVPKKLHYLRMVFLGSLL